MRQNSNDQDVSNSKGYIQNENERNGINELGLRDACPTYRAVHTFNPTWSILLLFFSLSCSSTELHHTGKYPSQPVTLSPLAYPPLLFLSHTRIGCD